MPNVQKNNYKRYERVDRHKSNKPLNSEQITSMFVQNFMKSTSNFQGNHKVSNNPGFFNKLQREISLGDKIRSKAIDKGY